MKTTVYLVRHAEAEGNLFRRLHGHYNSLLMPRGLEQRLYLTKRFENIALDAVYSSDLTRACMTAQSVTVPKGLPLHKNAGFREIDVGVWEDVCFGYLDRFYPEDMIRFSKDPMHWHVEGSESFSCYTDRFITTLRQVAEENIGRTIAVFSHGAVLRGSMMRLFFGNDPTKLSLCDNTGVSLLHYENGSFSYEYLNDNSHLPKELSTITRHEKLKNLNRETGSHVYFVPGSGQKLPQELSCWTGGGKQMLAMLQDQPVGYICWDEPQGYTGKILQIQMLKSMENRGFEDQLLGCGICHFRRLGCTNIELSDSCPQWLLQSYGFDPVSRFRSVDPNII